jgi:hypothetical protein
MIDAKKEDPSENLLKDQVSKEQLTQLFDGDWIRTNLSNQQLVKWGKYEGLYSVLVTNPKTGIESDPIKISQRRRLYDSNTPMNRKATTFF